ncbi:phosphate:Na+ symporter [Caldimonas brevitalea]|uniref:Phosphate:Na+ symporter n=2 Tax=Caldimonas brevitalea TaxID=413882 RepID=A0A0G3BQ35_9BURK|nr:phosphate:Na+ symporter [Caldimonas brevitalea]
MSSTPTRAVVSSPRTLFVQALVLLSSPVALAAPGGNGDTEVDWLGMGATFAAGLAVFLWSVRALAMCLRDVASERVKAVLHKSAGNRLKGLLSGTAVTVVLDSSSATIILLIALVDARLIGFGASLPVILGSNIGTTFSSQVFAVNNDLYAPALLLAGLLTLVLARADKAKRWGEVVFLIGLILFALGTLGDAMAPLADHDGVKAWLLSFAHPATGILAGAAGTVAIQSSSAMMAIVIALASQQLIGLDAGLALMLGAEIGTCADTLVAAIGRSAAALRAAAFHVGFNIVTAALGVALLAPLTQLARWSSSDVAHQIANAHVAFNVIGALLFIGFTGTAARWLERWVPERRAPAERLRPAADV